VNGTTSLAEKPMTGSYDIAEFCTFYVSLAFCLLTGYRQSESTPEELAI
jgi:hypothetical protein